MAWPGSSGIASDQRAAPGYDFTRNYSKRCLSSVAPLVVAAGGEFFSAVALAAPTALHWPATTPSPRAWLAFAALALGCTALAYLLFFRLIARIGAPRTMTMPFLIPLFGVFWGWLFFARDRQRDHARRLRRDSRRHGTEHRPLHCGGGRVLLGFRKSLPSPEKSSTRTGVNSPCGAISRMACNLTSTLAIP